MPKVPNPSSPDFHRRTTGSYYTPQPLARLTARLALQRFLEARHMAAPAPDARRLWAALPGARVPAPAQCYQSNDLATFRALDPAVGDGVFLLALLDEIVALGLVPSRGDPARGMASRSEIAGRCLYGLDIDAGAVAACREALFAAAGPLASEVDHLSGALDDHVRIGNALADAAGGPPASSTGLVATGSLGQDRFDLILGNPPWGAAVEPGLRRELRHHFRLAGRADSFGLFLLRSLDMLAPNGCLALLLPDILLLKDYTFLRERLLSRLRLTDLVLLGPAFPGVSSHAIVVAGCAEADPEKREAAKIAAWRWSPDGALEALPWLRQSGLRASEGCRFHVHLGNRQRDLRDRLAEASIPLGDLLETHEGIHFGNVRAKLFVRGPCPPDGHPLLLGRGEVERFAIHWAGRYVRYDATLVDRARGEHANLGHSGWFDAPKILVRRTGDFLLAALDREGYYCSNNLFVAFPRLHQQGLDLTYLVALLNSSLLTWYFRSLLPGVGRPFAELKLFHLRRVPLVVPEDKARYRLRAIGDELTEIYSRRPAASRRSRNAAEEALWRALDEEVFGLYGLTEQERAIVGG